MTTLTTLPVYPAPNRDTQVLFALTGTGANFVRVWVTAAPPGSELRKKLDASTQNRFALGEFDGGTAHPWRTRFDRGGKYTLVAQEYTRGASAYGGGYQGSPDGAPSETKVGSETTLSLYVGQRLTSEIKAGADTLTVVLWVFDATIRATTANVHGEDSPTIQATTETARSRAVVESATVLAALAALRNQATTDAIGTLTTVLDDLIAQWNRHLVQATIHANNDSLNGIPTGIASAASAASLADGITEMIPLLRQHYLNDAVKGGVVNGRDSADFHDVGGKKNDNANIPIVAGASQLGDAYWATADLCRSYEAHRVSAIHSVLDTVNALATRPLLMQVGEAVLAILAATDPAVPATQSTGAMNLIARAGFSESPL